MPTTYPIKIGPLEISEIRVVIHKTESPDKDKLRALVNVTFSGVFAVRGCKVIQGSQGLFAAMANVKGKDGSWKDCYCFLSKDTNSAMCAAIMAAYNDTISINQ